MYELDAVIFQSYVSMLYIRIDVCHLCLVSIAKFSDGGVDENFEEMVGMTREAAAVATESGGDETTTRPRMRPAVPGTRPATTAGDETAATGGVMYTDEGELEFDEDEMAALEGQRLVAELFPDSGSESDFEGFHASEPAGNLSCGDDSGSEAITESDDDEGMKGRLSDAAAAYRTTPNLPD